MEPNSTDLTSPKPTSALGMTAGITFRQASFHTCPRPIPLDVRPLKAIMDFSTLGLATCPSCRNFWYIASDEMVVVQSPASQESFTIVSGIVS